MAARFSEFARLDFHQVKRLADEVARTRLQRTKLVAGLGCEDDDGHVAVDQTGLQALHHLEAVHPRHLQVQQDQLVRVPAVQRAHLLRVHGGAHLGVTRLLQQLAQQGDVGLLVIDDEDACLQDVFFG